MPTENDPTITIEYFDSTWKSLLGYAKGFSVRDSGIMKIPTAKITLNNKGGHWTSGSSKIPDCSPIRITTDVRGVVDEIFRGYYLRYEGDFTRRKHNVTLKCKSYALKLLWDTITKPYHTADQNLGTWSMKDVIEDFLYGPDSGNDTGITLQTDSGDILTQHAIDDFDRETLLDALRSIAEEINYDGYVYDAPPNLKLNFKEVGTIQASPSITLAHPFVFIRPTRDCEEIRNEIYPWGDIEIGHPPSLDRWTEDHDRWVNLWVGDTGNTVTTSYACMVGTKSIKVSNTIDNDVGATLDISVDPDYPYIDCSTGRFVELPRWLYSSFQNNKFGTTIDLTDDLGTVIRRGVGNYSVGQSHYMKKEKWIPSSWTIGPDKTIHPERKRKWVGEWCYVSGSDFTWKVKKVRIWAKIWTSEAGFIHIDGLYFRGGARIDPLVNYSYYPSYPSDWPIDDDTSISLYGRRIKHIEDKQIRIFAQAEEAANRELASLKDPIRKVTCKKGAKTWAHPHEVVVLNLPEYEISSEYWRILELKHDWQSKGNVLRTTFTLVPYTAKVSTTAIQVDEPGGVMRSLMR